MIIRQSIRNMFIGIQWITLDGNPCVADPEGILREHAIAFGLPIFIVSFRWRRKSLTAMPAKM